MADCDDRQLTDAQRDEGARAQQRVAVQRTVAPYRGTLPPGMQGLMDWLNRQLVPVLQQTRNAVNQVWPQVVDAVPGTGNPLVHFFSEATGGGDPGTGRQTLNQADQSTATVLRLSDLNAQLADVSVFVETMQGSVTEPLGILTLSHASNPRRFIRFDLASITDEGTYWEMAVDPVEASHQVPFVEGDPITVAFLPGVGSNGAVVPIGSFELVAADTIMSNQTSGLAVPSPNPAVGFAGAGLFYDDVLNKDFNVGAGDGIDVLADSVAVDVTDLVDNVSITEVATNNIQRAALTGAIAASAGSNTTLFSGIRDNGSAESDRTNINVLSSTSIVAAIADDAGNDELEITHQRAALTGVIDAAQNSNATTSAEPFITYSASANMSAERVATSSTSVTVSTGVASQVEWQRAALTGAIAASANSNATVFSGIRDNGAAEADRSNLNWVAGTNTTVTITDDAGNDELEIAVNVDNFPLTGLADQAAGTMLANITAGAAPPTAHALATFAGAGLAYTNVTGILAVGAGTGITVNANDVQLATIADDTFMANVSGGAAVATGKTFASLAGAGLDYDATNHELDIALGDFDSTSIVVNGTVLERAALTGAIAAAQNTNTTTFSGIRDNGAAENDRSNLNFVSSTSCTAVVTDDAGNDELEVTYQRAALTGEVTASANNNATTIDKTISPTWTGSHTFSTLLAVSGSFSMTGNASMEATNFIDTLRWGAADTSQTITGTVEALTITGIINAPGVSAGAILDGIAGGSDGRVIALINASATDQLSVRNNQASTAANSIRTPNATTMLVPPQGGIILAYIGVAARWYCLAQTFVPA